MWYLATTAGKRAFVRVRGDKVDIQFPRSRWALTVPLETAKAKVVTDRPLRPCASQTTCEHMWTRKASALA